MSTTCTKRYDNLPFAHRQHRHAGHCRFIHGHNWGFEFEFIARLLDHNGFVIDFGDLKWLKKWLEDMFDHTLVLNHDDPALKYLQEGLLNPQGLQAEYVALDSLFPFADIRVVPNAGAEGLAEYVYKAVNELVMDKTFDRVQVLRVTVFEDSKNSATYRQ